MNQFEKVLRCSTDSIYEIAGFLTAEECSYFSQTCKSIYVNVESDKIWNFYALHRIQGFICTEFEKNYRKIDAFKRILGFSNSKDFYVAFRRLQFNLMGWFRALPPFTFGINGGLYVARIVEGEFLFQLVDVMGNIVGNESSFKLRYEKGSRSLVAKSYGAEGKTYFVNLSNEIIFFGPRCMNSPKALTREAAITLSTLPMNPNLDRLLSTVSKPYELASCLGLHTAPYGTHGLEILHLSLHDSSESCWIPNTQLGRVNVSFGSLQLHGLKIKGDPNVPAGQLSFCLNIDSTINPHHMIQSDRRTIVSFPPNSREPDFISLDERCDRIASWFRGYGQINRRPPAWNPEWVGCSLILYRHPLPNGAMFTILWDNESEYYRHAMDFTPLQQGSAPPFARPILM